MKIVFFGNRNVRVWFVLTIVPPFLPVMTSVISAAMAESEELDDYFKMSDLVFIGLSVNISTLNMLRSRLLLVEKSFLMIGVIVFTIALSTCLSMAYQERISPLRFSVIFVLTLSSIWVNLHYAKQIWRRTKHKKYDF